MCDGRARGIATSVVEIQIVGQHVVIEALKDHNHVPIVHDLSTNPDHTLKYNGLSVMIGVHIVETPIVKCCLGCS